MYTSYNQNLILGLVDSWRIFFTLRMIFILCEITFYVYTWLSVYSLRRLIQLGKPISLNWNKIFIEEAEDVQDELQPKSENELTVV